MTTLTLASTITVGQTIMPPARELRLWMRRDLAEKGLPESALHMKVIDVYPGLPDKRGPWLIIKATMSEAWEAGRPLLPWTIKARPETMWPVVNS